MAIRRPRTFRWTRAHLARLSDDGNRYEVLDGELLVTPPAQPRHQRIAVMLSTALENHCAAHGIGIVVGPGAVVWKKNELQPDIDVIPVTGPFALDSRWEDQPLPTLVVEVLSPGSHHHDLETKRAAYLRLGIPEYWVVDHEHRQIFVFRPGAPEPQLVVETLQWTPPGNAPPLLIDVPTLLAG